MLYQALPPRPAPLLSVIPSGSTARPLPLSASSQARLGLVGDRSQPGATPLLLAQLIVPAADGTGTQVTTPNGQTFDISGGTQAGSNLFQSFQQFGLTQNQTANFLSNPGVQNILGRVVGGDPSVINGLLQVTGSNANLFLLNPAGIILGPNASLNVPGSFTATTANALGLGSDWFNATGPVNYATLTAAPDRMAFTTPAPGVIVNSGNLSVGQGQSLLLLGGTVVNTGQLAAPGGQIGLVAVTGNQLVRLTQPGNLLSLEVQPLGQPSLFPPVVTPATLPQLLTGGTVTNATGVALNAAGQVVLSGSGMAIATTPGSTVASGTVTVGQSSGGSGAIAILGQQVEVQSAQINASNPSGGGTILIGGNYQGKGNLPNAQSTVISPDTVIQANAQLMGQGGTVVIWSDDRTIFGGTITAQGGLQGGNGGLVETSGKQTLAILPGATVSTMAPQGQFGIWLLDPADLTIVSSGGAGNLATIGGPWTNTVGGNNAFTTVDDSIIEFNLANNGNVLLEATNSITVNAAIDAGSTSSSNSLTFQAPSIILNASVTTSGSQIYSGSVTQTASQVTLTSAAAGVSFSSQLNLGGNNLTINAGSSGVTVSGAVINQGSGVAQTSGSLTVNTPGLTSFASTVNVATLTTDAGGTTQLSGNVTTVGGQTYGDAVEIVNSLNLTSNNAPITFASTLNSQSTPQNLTISAGQGTIQFQGTVGRNIPLNTLAITNAGNVVGSDIIAAQLVQSSGAGSTSLGNMTITGGLVSLSTSGAIQVGTITTNGGDVSLVSQTNSVTTGDLTTSGGDIAIQANDAIVALNLNSSSNRNGGNVTLNAPNTIQVSLINSQGQTRRGGSININSGTFRALNSFVDNNGIVASLSSAGGLVGGAITIRYLGGQVPFAVGNPRANGTLAAITSGANNSIFPNQVFSKTYREGNISLQPQQPYNSLAESPRRTLQRAGAGRERSILMAARRVTIATAIKQDKLEEAVPAVDELWSNQYERYYGREVGQGSPPTPANIQTTLKALSLETGKQSAVAYLFSQPDQIELILIGADAPLVHRTLPVKRETLLALSQQFRADITNPANDDYLESSQALYRVLIAPLEQALKAQGIETLLLAPDVGLRSLPLAALHDGKQFLIEKISLSLIPSMGLLDTRFNSIQNATVLAMGAATFADQKPLPAVPAELPLIVQALGRGQVFLNQGFTLENLKAQRQKQPYNIVHLATHGEFKAGSPQSSYIQFWNSRLPLDGIRQLQLDQPSVDLLVLSACRTALGSEGAEYGFGGLAVQTGAKSAMASLWYVSDTGALALMAEFYQQLRTAPIKAEALRRTQLAMLRGQVTIDAEGILQTSTGTIPLPTAQAQLGTHNLTHPYYWSAFTLIGSPW